MVCIGSCSSSILPLPLHHSPDRKMRGTPCPGAGSRRRNSFQPLLFALSSTREKVESLNKHFGLFGDRDELDEGQKRKKRTEIIVRGRVPSDRGQLVRFRNGRRSPENIFASGTYGIPLADSDGRSKYFSHIRFESIPTDALAPAFRRKVVLCRFIPLLDILTKTLSTKYIY